MGQWWICLPVHGGFRAKEWKGDGKVHYNLVEGLASGPEETSTSDNTQSSHMFTLKL